MISVSKHPLLILSLVVAVAVGAATINKMLGDKTNARGRTATPLRVVVEPARLLPYQDTIEANGTARAVESVELMSTVTETVRAVHFTDGMTVRQGDVLIELTSAEESAVLAEARAALAEARRVFERNSNLVAKGDIAESVVDQARADLDTAEARVEGILARLDDRVIRAPFSGVLGFRQVSPGTLVSANTVITTLDDVSTIIVDFSVPEAFLANLRVGQNIDAESPAYPDRRFAGSVTTIRSRIDPVTRAATVRAALANDERLLRPGMLLAIELIERRGESLFVPEESLVPVRDRQFVFRVDDESVVRQAEVQTGRRQRGFVEVVEGLQPGDLVITRGTTRVRDGVTVDLGEGDASDASRLARDRAAGKALAR